MSDGRPAWDGNAVDCGGGFQRMQIYSKRPSRLSQKKHTVSQKKFPPLNSLQLYQILTDFQNFCITGKHVKFATKPIRQYPPQRVPR